MPYAMILSDWQTLNETQKQLWLKDQTDARLYAIIDGLEQSLKDAKELDELMEGVPVNESLLDTQKCNEEGLRDLETYVMKELSGRGLDVDKVEIKEHAV